MDAGHYVRHASRALRARPVLTLVCVSIIALGIGASTAVASAVHALLMRPLPLPHADRLVTGFALREGFDPFGTCLLEYEAFGALTGGVAGADAGADAADGAGAAGGAGAFERIGLARRHPATLRVGADSVRVQAATITGSYLATADVSPALGRTIGPADDRPGAPAVVAIGHALWTRQLGARADVIGSTLLVDGRPATVVGVMPALFDLPNGAELWLPMRIVPGALTLEQRLQSAYTFLGRLRPGVSIERVNTDVLAITRGLASQAWPGQDPLGRRIRRGRAGDTNRPWLTVVGIVEDVKEDRFNFRIDRAGWYMPYAQEDNPAPVNLVMRSTLDTATLVRTVRERVRAFDPDIAVVDLMPMTRHTAEVLVSERFAAVLLSVLAAAGLLLAMLGLYGAISHVVLSKRTEMALRLAVGAPRAHVVAMVVREVALVAVTGIAVGAVAAAIASRALGTILYGVAPYDGLTYASAAALVAIVSTFAAWAPAVRAAHVDPASLLR